MGGTVTKSKSDLLSESINDIVVNSMQNCSSNSDIEQIINVKGQGNVLSDIEMDQVFNTVMTCVNKSEWMADLQTQIEEKLNQSAASQSVAVLGALGNSSANVTSTIRNSVKSAINVATVSNMVNNARQRQVINVEGVGNTVIKVSMNQVNNNIALLERSVF
jgi:hypothetical protein